MYENIWSRNITAETASSEEDRILLEIGYKINQKLFEALRDALMENIDHLIKLTPEYANKNINILDTIALSSVRSFLDKVIMKIYKDTPEGGRESFLKRISEETSSSILEIKDRANIH
jgi:hypothetical protein